MDKLKKIQADILQGNKDSNIRFSDLQKLLAAIGGKERVKGDHFIYSFTEIEAIFNRTERWLRRTKLGKLGSSYLKTIC